MKKILALLLVLCMLVGVCACGATTEPVDETPANETPVDEQPIEDPKAEDPAPADEDPKTEDPAQTTLFSGEDKVIDIYLIAGQSNAVGYSKIENTKEAYAFAPELKRGFKNVLFAGVVRWGGDSGAYESKDYDWRPTVLGLGKGADSEYIGPEAGIAKGLSEYYNEESGKVAGIIKHGHGGTSLLDNVTGVNSHGNWASPTYAEKVLGMNKAAYESSAVGGLYRSFLEVVEAKLCLLVIEGYTNFNIKGIYWMQGETDREKPDEYKVAFGYFASDLRRDLAKLATELTGEDRGASNMPIFVGTISQTFNLNTGTMESVNVKFIEMQKALPDTVENCYIIDNSQYALSKYREGSTILILGSDQHHWKQSDHLQIGYNAGHEMLLQNGLLQ